MIKPIIKATNLSFAYSKKKNVLHNINLNVPQGSIYGFLGPNGAGKSTTMQILTGILPSEDGVIEVFQEKLNIQFPKIFSKVGALVETPTLYVHLSGIDNLRCITTLKEVSEEKIVEVLELVGLSKNGHQKVKQYSLGMRQRLAIAMTLIGEPELLLLDEPVNGLDPTGMTEIRELLVKLNKEKGITIFISSHLLTEVEKMCTHIGIIHQGSMQFEGSIEELSKKAGTCNVVAEISDLETHFSKIKENYPTISYTEKENQFKVTLNSKGNIPELSKFLIENNISLFELKITEGLEEWFLSLTK